MHIRRMKDLRDDADVKQNVLAEYLGIKQSTYSDYENGKINVPIEALVKVSDFYHVSLDYLVGKTDIRTPYPKSNSGA